MQTIAIILLACALAACLGVETSRYVKSRRAKRSARYNSPLVRHARRELLLINEDDDVIEWMEGVVRAWGAFGHSGGSHAALLPVLVDLLNYENLAPLTDNPNEWIQHDAGVAGEFGTWQNKRNFAAFSDDGGRTYTKVDDTSDTLWETVSWADMVNQFPEDSRYIRMMLIDDSLTKRFR